jgi:hypothetical protein
LTDFVTQPLLLMQQLGLTALASADVALQGRHDAARQGYCDAASPIAKTCQALQAAAVVFSLWISSFGHSSACCCCRHWLLLLLLLPQLVALHEAFVHFCLSPVC